MQGSKPGLKARGGVAHCGRPLRIREDLVTTVAVMRVTRQGVTRCECPPRECCPQRMSAEGFEGVGGSNLYAVPVLQQRGGGDISKCPPDVQHVAWVLSQSHVYI